jgi:hypothetical protein
MGTRPATTEVMIVGAGPTGARWPIPGGGLHRPDDPGGDAAQQPRPVGAQRRDRCHRPDPRGAAPARDGASRVAQPLRPAARSTAI